MSSYMTYNSQPSNRVEQRKEEKRGEVKKKGNQFKSSTKGKIK